MPPTSGPSAFNQPGAPNEPGASASCGAGPAGLSDVLRRTNLLVRAAGDQRDDAIRRSATDQLLATAVSVLAGALSAASITYRIGSGRPATLASTGELATRVDELQYRTEQGPCLDALTADPDNPPNTGDLRADGRWPSLAAALASTGEARATSVLSVPLPLPAGDAGSLNLYGATNGRLAEPGWAAVARDAGAVLTLGLGNLLVRRRADHLTTALDSNRQIGAAVGVLMTRYRWTYDQAFAMLRDASQLHHRKLRELADEVLYTGALPGAPS